MGYSYLAFTKKIINLENACMPINKCDIVTSYWGREEKVMQTRKERWESRLQAITKYEPSRKGLTSGTVLFDFISSILANWELKPAPCPGQGLLGGCPAWYSHKQLGVKLKPVDSSFQICFWIIVIRLRFKWWIAKLTFEAWIVNCIKP